MVLSTIRCKEATRYLLSFNATKLPSCVCTLFLLQSQSHKYVNNTSVHSLCKVFCSLHPVILYESVFLQPKIVWMKNQMIIGDDPKFRQICVQGICSLEIRKPGNFDGGVYSCRAKNDHGEATVSCKLEVKRKSGS